MTRGPALRMWPLSRGRSDRFVVVYSERTLPEPCDNLASACFFRLLYYFIYYFITSMTPPLIRDP